jgi:glycosyltransferase involved in cell wall biosynthesis
MYKHILVITSTFPASELDPVPTFVRDQIIALKRAYPNISFSVLAPYDARSSVIRTQNLVKENEFYKEYRFHYFWPFFLEKLTGRGIIPTVKQNPLYYALIPCLLVAEFFTLLRYTRKLKPDILYAHWFTPQGINAGLVSNITKIPFVYTSHSSDVAVLRKLPIVGPFIVRYISKRARAITVVSRRTLEKLRKFFTDKQWKEINKKVNIIPMGVLVTEQVESIKKTKINAQNILFLGRLEEKKGVQILLPAFAAICDSHPQVTLTIAGDGSWYKRLQRQAENLKIPDNRITFTGYVRGDKKTKLIAKADIFVVPSIQTSYGDTEGLPVALMEGLAAGKICIATNESGADDILINEENGFLIPQKDILALETVLHTTLNLIPKQKMRIKNEALITAQQFSWHNIAKQYSQFLFDT